MTGRSDRCSLNESRKRSIQSLPFLQATNRTHRSRFSPSISLSRDPKKLARLDKNDLRGDSFFYYRESFTHISHLHKRAPWMRVYSYTTFPSPLLLSLSLSPVRLLRAPVLPVDASVCIHVLGYDRVGPLSGPADCLWTKRALPRGVWQTRNRIEREKSNTRRLFVMRWLDWFTHMCACWKHGPRCAS